MSVLLLDRKPRVDIEDTALGRFAYKLRRYMCAGSDAALLSEDMKSKVYAAFAGLEANSATRTLATYKYWVQKLATKEYADELVVLACAEEFKIRIVCVPHTPGGVLPKWSISKYQPPNQLVTEDQTIYLGNNDVHYMWLAIP